MCEERFIDRQSDDQCYPMFMTQLHSYLCFSLYTACAGLRTAQSLCLLACPVTHQFNCPHCEKQFLRSSRQFFVSLSIASSDTKRTVSKGQSSEIFAVCVLTDKTVREIRVDDTRRKMSETSKETRKRTNVELVNNERSIKRP